MSSTEIEATLPLTAPNAERHPNPQNAHPDIPVYTVLKLKDKQIDSLLYDLNNYGCCPDSCCRAANPAVADVRAAYEDFIQQRDLSDTHPTHFIVADKKKWNLEGVLLVNLAVKTPARQNVIGVMRCGTDMADSFNAILNGGSMDWIEVKEMEQARWRGEDPYTNERYFETNAMHWSGAPPVRYAWYSRIEKPLPVWDLLEPDWTYKHQPQRRMNMMGNLSTYDDPWEHIRRDHPFNCLREPTLHHRLVAVVEGGHPELEDVAIAELQWKGDLSQFSYDPETYEGTVKDAKEVQAIMPKIRVLKHAKPSNALNALDHMNQKQRCADKNSIRMEL